MKRRIVTDGKNYWLQIDYGLNRIGGGDGWQNIKHVSERYALNKEFIIQQLQNRK